MIKENKAIKLIKFIKDNYCDDEESSFCDGLLYYRNHNNLDDLGNEILPHLNEMLSNTKNNSYKAAIIETIMAVESSDVSEKRRILDEYIFLLSQKSTTNYKAARCLRKFIILGANEEEVCNKVIKYMDKNDAIQILANMDMRENYSKDIPGIPKEFFTEINMFERIVYRSGVISTFLSIVHPLCVEYARISKISFGYPSIEAAVLDWAWKKPGGASHLAENGIFTVKETEILEKLGRELDNMLSENSNNIKLDLDKIRDLYYEFFNNKNPLDVMFTLPE